MIDVRFNHLNQEIPKLERVVKDGKRFYQTPKGDHYPSITTILGEIPNKELVKWEKRLGSEEANKQATRAADRGTLMHGLAEAYLNNQKPEADHPIAKRLFMSIKPLLNQIQNVRMIEKPLYSDRLRMAGTPDIIADYAKVLSVIDFKTSNRLKDESWIGHYFMQVGAYAVMYEEHFGVWPERGVIIIANEESNWPQIFIKDTNECFAMFKGYVRELIEYRKTQGVK